MRASRGPRTLALALALLAVARSQAADWSGVGRLSGSVIGAEGRPIAQARVTLHFEGSDRPGPATQTDDRGRFALLGLAAGRWRVVIEAAGYLRAEGEATVVEEGPGPRLRFELRPLAALSPTASEPDRRVVREHIEDGNRLLAAGRHAEARDAYERALPELPPEARAPVWRAIARSWYAQGERGRAIAALEQAVAADRFDDESAALLDLIATGEPAPSGAVDPRSLPRVPPTRDRTGTFVVSFRDRSPLAPLDDVIRRTGIGRRELAAAGSEARAIDLGAEEFALHVPETYHPDRPHGLIVWISPGPFGGSVRPDIHRLLAERRLIWVGANAAGNDRPRWHRVALALDAAANVARLYAIDPERIYAAGYSGGGRAASIASVVYPEVFRGGLFLFGCDFYRALPVPDRPGAHWPALYRKPPGRDLARARESNRYVFLTGERDFNRLQTRDTERAARADGFRHTTYLELPDIGHFDPVPAADWARALDALDGASR